MVTGLRNQADVAMNEASTALWRLRLAASGKPLRSDGSWENLPNEPRTMRVVRRALVTISKETNRLLWEVPGTHRDRARIAVASARTLWRYREKWHARKVKSGPTFKLYRTSPIIADADFHTPQPSLMDEVYGMLFRKIKADAIADVERTCADLNHRRW